jgi:hypothetical protein
LRAVLLLKTAMIDGVDMKAASLSMTTEETKSDLSDT